MTDREALVEFLPKGGMGAEIGVAHGDFAAVLLAKAAPRGLHLIDPWSHHEGGAKDRGEALASALAERAHATGPAPAPDHNAAGDRQFRAVQDRFTGEPRVTFHRQFSYRAVTEFPDRHFDFVYIDGNHGYEYVLRDLVDCAPKIKDDGLIMGHDFFEDAFAAGENYGIIAAVDTFIKRTNAIFVALTWEPFSTFVLAKRFDGFAQQFVRNMLESQIGLISWPMALAFRYNDLSYKRSDGATRRIPSFGFP